MHTNVRHFGIATNPETVARFMDFNGIGVEAAMAYELIFPSIKAFEVRQLNLIASLVSPNFTSILESHRQQPDRKAS